MITYYITSNQQELHMQVHVNDEGIVVAVGSPERPCFRSNFIGEPWDTVRKRFEERGWSIRV
jgi:hypothetical protein